MTVTRGGSLIIGNRVARAGLVAGSDALFCVDLAPNLLDVTVEPTLNTAGDATFGQEFVEQVRTSWMRSITVGSMYRHDPGAGVDTTTLFDALQRNQRKGTVLLRARDGYWLGGEYTTDGPEQSNPSDGLMTGSFGFMPTHDWVAGSASAAFRVEGNTAAQSEAIPAQGAGTVAYVAVLEQAAGTTVTTQVGSNAPQEAAGSGPRIFSLPVGANTVRVGKTAAGAGAVAGFVLVGRVQAVN